MRVRPIERVSNPPARGRAFAARSPVAAGALALLVMMAAGCAADAESRIGLEATVDTVGGVERLTYGTERAPQLPWSFDTTAVVGGFGIDDPDYQFGGLSPASLAGDEEGNLYVLDGDGIRILGYGPDGTFFGRWGREGGGPGELGGGFGGGPRAMAMGRGDTLWINDGANQRFTLIPVGGGEPTSIPLPQSGLRLGGDFALDDGGATALLSSFSFRPGEAEGLPPRPLVRIGRDGETTDTLWIGPAPETDVVTISSGGRNLVMMMSRRFSPGFRWIRFSDGGYAVQETAAYEIRLLDETGAERRTLRREPPPRPTTDADRQAVLDSLLAPPEEETQFNTDEVRRQQAEATTFAELIPRIVEMRRDTKDRLWVGVSEERPGVIERIDVYARDGTLLGELREVPMPDHFFADGRAAIIDRDELDVQRVHVLRLLETPEQLESAGG